MFLSRGERDLGVAFQTHPGRQASISSGSKEPRSALESRRVCRTSMNFRRFMNDVVRAYADRELHVVADNLNIHKNEALRRWLARHPRVRFHYTPTHASWVN